MIARVLLVIAASLMLAGAGCTLGLQWAFAHDHYGTWFGADGGACCSDLGRECRPVRSYPDDDGAFRILLNGRWTPVPARAVRPYRSPDGSSHACIGKDGTIFCFVPGDLKS